MNARRLIPALALAALALTACGNDKAADDKAFDAPTVSESPSATMSESPSPSVSESPSETTEENTPPESSSTVSEPPATSEAPAVSEAILNGWPTAADIGSDGSVRGPKVEMKPLTLQACGEVFTFDAIGRVDARMQQPEDFRARSYATYPNESESRAALSGLEQMFRYCKQDDQSPGWITEVSGDAFSDGGLQIAQGFNDKYGVGVQSTVVFMRGTTMVISTQSNEGSGLKAARRGNIEQVEQLQPLLAEIG